MRGGRREGAGRTCHGARSISVLLRPGRGAMPRTWIYPCTCTRDDRPTCAGGGMFLETGRITWAGGMAVRAYFFDFAKRPLFLYPILYPA
jgi:hypothetical protein